MAVAMAVSSEWPRDLPQVVCDPGRTFDAGSEGGPAGTRAQILPQGMNVTHTHTHAPPPPRSTHGLPYYFTDS